MIAERLAAALHGRRSGAGWMARCPAHDDRHPSLSIQGAANGTVLVRCHAGCDQSRVIAALRASGLWQGRSERRHQDDRPTRRESDRQRDRDDIVRTEAAISIWAAAKPAMGTPVETYLHSRGLSLPVPNALRFHAGLKHPSGGVWPAMVALVTSGTQNASLAIHRTFLADSGADKAPVEPQRMMLGSCRGGAVRFSAPSKVLVVGEGIETCLSAMMATGHAVWSALSTSGLRALDLPERVRDVIVLADGDPPGEAAARDCAYRWARSGRRVRIAHPPNGLDFNDVLLGRTSRIEGGAK